MVGEGGAPRDTFDDFVRARWDAAVRVAWGLTLDAGQAEDLAQEAFARLWPSWPRLANENPVGYLNRTIANLFLSGLRRRRVAERLRSVASNVVRDPAAEVGERDALLRAMKRLSPQQRLVLVLRYVEDMSTEEVATVLGCSIGTVKTHAFRGTRAMRELLEPSSSSRELLP